MFLSETSEAVKAVGGNELMLDLLGMPHGTDRQGQIFDAATDLGDLPIVPVVYWHGFDQQGAPKVERIGWATKSQRDAAGQWYRATLDKAKATAQKIYADAMNGMARVSSDAIAHLVRPVGILGKPGYVSSWPIGALSLMDADTYQSAINPRAIAIPALKAFLSELTAEIEVEQGKSEIELGEAAAKAGATFARRNRERILAIKQALDELMQEMPSETETQAEQLAKQAAPELPIVASEDVAQKADIDTPKPEQSESDIAARIDEMIARRLMMYPSFKVG
jgi:hypothetical protein